MSGSAVQGSAIDLRGTGEGTTLVLLNGLRLPLGFAGSAVDISALPLAASMDDAEADVLAYMSFPKEHRAKLRSTNPLERINGEIKRRTEVVGIFPNEDAIVRLVGAILLETNDEWAIQRARYMSLETMAPLSDDGPVALPALPA